jgi:electron transport complex protein RnfG
MAKLGITLAIFATIACVCLAFVYEGTARIIAQRQQEDLDHALRALFPEADSFRAITDITSPDPEVTIEGDAGNPNNTGAFAAIKGGDVIGVALRTSRASYSGAIKILVGIGTDSKIHGVTILQNTDTPGLGANAGSTHYYVDRAKGIHFYDQFVGKNVTDPFVPKQDVIAITASTITSRAVSASVKAAGQAASAWLASGGSR